MWNWAKAWEFRCHPILMKSVGWNLACYCFASGCKGARYNGQGREPRSRSLVRPPLKKFLYLTRGGHVRGKLANTYSVSDVVTSGCTWTLEHLTGVFKFASIWTPPWLMKPKYLCRWWESILLNTSPSEADMQPELSTTCLHHDSLFLIQIK